MYFDTLSPLTFKAKILNNKMAGSGNGKRAFRNFVSGEDRGHFVCFEGGRWKWDEKKNGDRERRARGGARALNCCCCCCCGCFWRKEIKNSRNYFVRRVGTTFFKKKFFTGWNFFEKGSKFKFCFCMKIFAGFKFNRKCFLFFY